VIIIREVYLVVAENLSKAEDVLKKDETINRGSITTKSAASLDIKENGYFIILDCNEKALKKAEELLQDIAVKYKYKEKVLSIVDEQEASAIEGFGNILG